MTISYAVQYAAVTVKVHQNKLVQQRENADHSPEIGQGPKLIESMATSP